MANKAKLIFEASLVDETYSYSLKELCNICEVHAEIIIEMVEHGIIEPKGKKSQLWKFSAYHIQRTKRALRLQRDLDLNLSGVALSLELLEKINHLQAELNRLQIQTRMLDINKHI